ncbi:MAG: hypothetical protein DMF51_10385 [Acidobacteria bacterium]|nr:MAG: hypothetical protein DMF51_10385 [Acidobacteriota bacterium]
MFLNLRDLADTCGESVAVRVERIGLKLQAGRVAPFDCRSRPFDGIDPDELDDRPARNLAPGIQTALGQVIAEGFGLLARLRMQGRVVGEKVSGKVVDQ